MPHRRFYRYNEFSWQTCFDHHVESFICICYFNTLRPRQNGRHFPDDIFKSIFLNKNISEFWFRFHWSWFPTVQLTIFQHWIRKWLDAGQATSHYLNQWCLVYWRIYALLGLNDLINDHDNVIKWKHFPRYWPFVRGIPRIKASDAELWCFRWSAPEQTAEWTMVRLVIWDAIAPIMTSPQC